MSARCDERPIGRRRISSGKRTELEERDRRFLELARKIALEEGFAVFTMSRLAEASGFTRGTLYQRFCSREGILVELWIQCLTDLADFMEKAAGFEGTTRERGTAVGEAIVCYFRRHPENLRLLGIVATEDTQQALSEEQRTRLDEADTRMLSVFFPIAGEALEKGELVLPRGARLETFCLSLWALLYGVTEVMRGGLPLQALRLEDPLEEFLKGLQWMLDGYGWRPYSHEFDYETTRCRVRAFLSSGEGTD